MILIMNMIEVVIPKPDKLEECTSNLSICSCGNGASPIVGFSIVE
jgi:hypothetical protein